MRGLIALALVAGCQSADQPKAVAPPRDAGSDKPQVFALGGTAAKTPPSWAPAAIAKITALKDAMCACVDRACTDQVTADMKDWAKQFDVSPEKADQATQNKILELSIDTSKCKLKVAGTPEVAPTANTAFEGEALDLMDKLAELVALNAKDCGKLATALDAFTAEHRAMITQTHGVEKARSPLARKAFGERNKARLEATALKMKPAMDACGKDPKVQAAATAMAK